MYWIMPSLSTMPMTSLECSTRASKRSSPARAVWVSTDRTKLVMRSRARTKVTTVAIAGPQAALVGASMPSTSAISTIGGRSEAMPRTIRRRRLIWLSTDVTRCWSAMLASTPAAPRTV